MPLAVPTSLGLSTRRGGRNMSRECAPHDLPCSEPVLVSEPPTLLARVASGDASAVAQLLDRYGGLVWSIVRGRVAISSAEDAVQEIFIELWKHADRFDPAQGSEATFIATIARRRLIDHQRRAGRQRPAEEIDERVAEEPRPDAVALTDEARLAALEIERLPPDQRRVLRLAVVDGLTHAQIATRTRLPLGTVKSHARRGLDRIRARIASDEVEGPREPAR